MWCTTSSSTPNWRYSFFSVLKQWAQVATTLVALASLSVSAFSIASPAKTNSLPERRAGSPVQVSPLPSTAKSTPAVCSSSATAWVVFLARSSYAPAQPTQNSHSTSVRSSTSTPTCLTSNGSSLAQSIRAFGRHVPGVALVLQALEEPVELGRELRLDHHLVPAHVHDVVDVLDVDRALLDAGAARRARPQHVRVDHADTASASADQRTLGLGSTQLRQRGPRLLGRLQVGRLGVRVVAQVPRSATSGTAASRCSTPGTATGSGRTRCSW